jgi:hypothetical protein
MKYLVLSMFVLVVAMNTQAQTINQKVMDEKSQKEILIGECTEAGLQLGEFGLLYTGEFNAYRPNNDAMNSLKYKFDDITFTIVLGTWCDDTKEQLGRFTKLLYALKYDINRCTFIAVDRTKTAGTYPMANLLIEKVPTFIVNRNGVEIGRSTETPVTTLEEDLLLIITKK